MRIGWPPRSTTIADRNDSLNNFVAETWATNFMRGNIEGNEYDIIERYARELSPPLSGKEVCYGMEESTLVLPMFVLVTEH